MGGLSMSDYISRRAFIADCEGRYCAPCKEQGKDANGVRCRACWVDDMLLEVLDAPAADVEPVRQNKIEDIKYDAQEREKIVVQLRKQWQAAEMFVCTMCGHFDHNIDGNIVYGNRECCEIVGYPYCKKFTPWISASVRLPEERGCYLVAVRHWYDGKPVTREAFWNGADWLSCEKKVEITPQVTHWQPLPELPKEGGTENG